MRVHVAPAHPRSWFWCRYCGARCGPARVCWAHSDLPAREPDLVAALLERVRLRAIARRIA